MTAFERIGRILSILFFTAVALVMGLAAGKYISDYSAAAPAAPAAVADTFPSVPPPSASDAASADERQATISDPDFKRMTEEFERAAGRYPAQVSIYVKNLETGKEWSYKADRLMPSASLIKVPVMVGTFEKIRNCELSLDQSLALTKSARRSGSGHLKWRRNGDRFTVQQLLEEMIHVSDNIAQEMLIRQVGLEYLQAQFPSYGLSVTNITRQGLSLSPRTAIENYTTSREMGRLLEHIYRGEKFGRETSDQMIELLKGVKYNERLPRYLPAGWSMAHKTGLLRRACHDCGVVFSPAGDYIICVMTSNNRNYRDAKRFISKIGSISFKYFNIPGSSVAAASALRPSSAFKRAS